MAYADLENHKEKYLNLIKDLILELDKKPLFRYICFKN